MMSRDTSGWVVLFVVLMAAAIVACVVIGQAIDDHHKLVMRQAQFETRLANHAIQFYEAAYRGCRDDLDQAIDRIESLERKLGESQ